MAFLFPVSIPPRYPVRSKKHLPHIIKLNRSISDRQRIRVNFGRLRDVTRVCPQIEWLSEEYFLVLKDKIPVFSFYCSAHKRIVSLDFCFASCRWRKKIKCELYIMMKWGCLTCPYSLQYKTCKRINECKYRKYIADWVSLYFAELMKLPHIVRRMRYGKGFKKNTRGNGPQLYLSVGKLPEPTFRRRRMYISRRVGIAKYKERIRKKRKLMKDKLHKTEDRR